MIPTILIHNGFFSYVDIISQQASKYNQTFLITDTTYPKNNKYEIINIQDLYNYDKTLIDQFHNNYIHLHKGPKEPVLFWITRWFILYNFCRMCNTSVVFHIDSDVLLFSDPNQEWQNKYNNYFMTLILGACGSTSFFSLESLALLTEFINKIYKDKTINLEMLQHKYSLHLKYNLDGGVCDMSLLKMFKDNCGINRIGEMTHVINDETYDHNINVDDYEYKMHNGIKQLEIINGKPAVFNTRLNKQIIFNGLHFQGHAKRLIHLMYESLS